MSQANRRFLLVFFILLCLVFGFAIVLFLSKQPASSDVLPTLIIFNTSESNSENLENSTNTPQAVSSLISATDEETLDSSTEAATEIPSEIAISTISVFTPTTSISLNPTATTNQNQVAIAPISSPIATEPFSTATNTLSPTATSTHTPAIPTATLDTTGLIPFGQAAAVNNGELRVLAAIAPANSFLTTLTTNLPTIGANQQWVLIELMQICDTTANCNQASSNFTLQSNAQTYAVQSLGIDTAFGGEGVAGQLWGYMAFVIPSNEQVFALNFTNNSIALSFALQ